MIKPGKVWSCLTGTICKTFFFFFHLIVFAGKDATRDFEDIGHSDSAKEMMSKYCIGNIDSSTIPDKRVCVPLQATFYPERTSDLTIKILQFLVPVLILGLAFTVRHFTKVEE